MSQEEKEFSDGGGDMKGVCKIHPYVTFSLHKIKGGVIQVKVLNFSTFHFHL